MRHTFQLAGNMQRILFFLYLIMAVYSVSALRCSRYLSNTTNVHSFRLRAVFTFKHLFGREPRSWVVKHDGKDFGEILENDDLSLDIEEGDKPLGKCMPVPRGKGGKGGTTGGKGGKGGVVLKTLLTCNWPNRTKTTGPTPVVQQVSGSIKFDPESKLPTVVVNEQILSSSRKIWNTDRGPAIKNLKDKNQDAMRKKIVFDENPNEILNGARVAFARHKFRAIPTFTICIGTDEPLALETAKRDALMYATMAIAYKDTDRWG